MERISILDVGLRVARLDKPVFAGRYLLLEHIGTGRYSDVFLAKDQQAGDGLRAVKIIKPECAGTPSVIRMAIQEATIGQQVQHPNVVRAFEFNRVSGRPFVVMEYLDGEDLLSLLGEGRALDLPSLSRVIVQACDGLETAHNAGFVHRDVKLENLFAVRETGGIVIKVIDWGLAKRVGRSDGHIVRGTAHYLAPEQIYGKPADTRTDQYALAAVAYRAAYGRYMFSADAPEDMLQMHLCQPVQIPCLAGDVDGISERLGIVLRRALEKKPDDRFPTMTEFKQAFLAIGL